MKEKMSIGEFAKLKNVSQETLRHYDRIGLLKPQWVDETSGYRYYSIFQYEKLSTILELRQLGMSLFEIKDFFEKRDVEKTITLLENQHKKLEDDMKCLLRLNESISHKLTHLKKYKDIQPSDHYEVKCLPERKILLWNQELDHNLQNYGYVELEKQLEEVAPIFAENRYGIRISQEDPSKKFIFLFLQNYKNIEAYHSVEQQTIPAGKYASSFFGGTMNGLCPFLDCFQRKIIKQHFQISGDIIIVVQIDLSVVGDTGKMLYEIQIPIKNG